ncbi:hypothetical protein HF265_18055 [Rhizobium leguminosarum]|uniref:deoxycytidylate deaminase n=1 Tax=Rhizobium leguminosarum TaxID=384 RepID=UPI001C91D5FD|nr:deaminase [Rhizobium leguminosarum]MBY3030981.1 hypothetical protein [Rhizobium leguminosarum]
MTTYPSDGKFLILCEEVKGSSHDPHRKVGVVIVDEAQEVVAQGSNAPPLKFGLSKSESHSAIAGDPTWKYFMLEHAERNAIFSAHNRGISLDGATMYGTLFPCADCARAIVAAGIRRLVVSTGDHDTQRDQKWRDHYLYARQIFKMGGVEVESVPAVRETKTG